MCSAYKILNGSKTYYFDVNESVDGIKYLKISESKKTDDGTYEHHRVFVFQDHLKEFDEGYKKAVKFMFEEGKSKA